MIKRSLTLFAVAIAGTALVVLGGAASAQADSAQDRPADVATVLPTPAQEAVLGDIEWG